MSRPLPANHSLQARLARLSRQAAHHALGVECYDEMCLAAAQYQADPSPANAVKAHLAARRYVDATEIQAPLTPLDGGRT